MKGILFKPDMIKAIVEGRKTVTRRVVKFHKPVNTTSSLSITGKIFSMGDSNEEERLLSEGIIKPGLSLSRYQVGEVVYIKEALFRHPYLDEAGYVLDETPVFINQTIGDCLKWRWQKDILNGMFMPQEAARYFIRIKDVRAERLQEITEADAVKEGIDGDFQEYPRLAFSELWDSINKPPYDWQSNCWVWVYSFKLTEAKL